MSFRSYIERHYVEAHNPGRNVNVDKEMLNMLSASMRDPSLVKKWMQAYGLIRGINADDRDKAADCFLDFAASHQKVRSPLTDEAVAQAFLELLTALHTEVPRGWLSATSKLLWCLYPRDIVIYDAFVQNTLTVMQCIDGDLSSFKVKIGKPPTPGATIEVKNDYPENAKNHYMAYSSMVRKLCFELSGVAGRTKSA